ncbi:hypothetical protein GA0070624_3850 [Micromonospora rhizosphaerae]|uniref:Flavin reductase n=1 Tax=Micromonospora rhizosphaerae TaxID=568872 RepID=A0A1C6SI95_9ACTN|nr:hypothetical protein [Micromonospora rhizosphaerae]SCL29264.1 hypothetical protein GA0070624_3850 [Micromonospora rhizosphaerae]
MTGEQRRVLGYPIAGEPVEHLPLRPLWLCRRCGQPWPCGAAKLVLLAEYQDTPVSLFLYLAGCLHDAIDDLHRLNPSETGSAADMFDRFLSWPARHTRSYRVTTVGGI